jgi:hypothetical protein
MYDYFFSGSQYIRVQREDTGPGYIQYGPAPISEWNWPDGFGAGGIDAALYSGSVCYFFKGAQYIQVSRGLIGAGCVTLGPRPISDWKWPNGFGAEGIDAALWSGPVCYFFKGNSYIRVTRGNTNFGTTDAGYPRSILGGWGWAAPFDNGVKGALPSGSKCYFFNGTEYIRVSRGIELGGFIDKGYPSNITAWDWGSFGAKGIDAALYSGGPLVPPPPEGLVSNYNYFLANGGKVLTGVSATINIDNDFITSANGFSLQFNGYSEEASGVIPTWQQYVIYLSPNSTQLWARIDNWYGTVPAGTDAELIRSDVPLATLPTANTIKAGSSITFTLNNDCNGNITGCTYTVVDPTGKTLGNVTMNIIGQPIWGTTKKATAADCAPIVAFTFNIGGDYGGSNATLTQAQGSITYTSSNQLTALSIEPSYTSFGDGTGETANIIYAGLPQSADVVMSQLFGTTPTASEPSEAQLKLEQEPRHRHVLPAPRHRHALPKPLHLTATQGIYITILSILDLANYRFR